MPVVSLKNSSNARVIYQSPDNGDYLAENTLVVALDAAGTLFLQAEDNIICLNRSTIPVLTKILKEFVDVKGK